MRVRIIVIVALLAFVVGGLPSLVGLYWVDVLTATAIYSLVTLGLGLLVGRVGLYSLGQIAILAVGGWVAARLLYATTLPFPLILLIAGIVATVLGVIIGLPALRVTGLYLALITLMLAGAINVVLAVTNFPNGGKGFLGYSSSPYGLPGIRRPGIASTDVAYFRYTVITAIVMFLVALWHVRTRPGRAWAAIRQSEPAAFAAGVNVALYKLWAFALAAFMTGVAGGLLGASAGQLYTYQFPPSQSIVLLAVVLMGGVYSLWGAVVAALLMQFFPAVLQVWGASPNLATILFGVGVLQVFTTAPTGLAGQVPKDLGRLGHALAGLVRRKELTSEATE
jgi:branched-chain amino acid transport system permease protein